MEITEVIYKFSQDNLNFIEETKLPMKYDLKNSPAHRHEPHTLQTEEQYIQDRKLSYKYDS